MRTQLYISGINTCFARGVCELSRGWATGLAQVATQPVRRDLFYTHYLVCLHG